MQLFRAITCTIHADFGGGWKSVFICIFVSSNPTLHITGVEWKLLKGYLGSWGCGWSLWLAGNWGRCLSSGFCWSVWSVIPLAVAAHNQMFLNTGISSSSLWNDSMGCLKALCWALALCTEDCQHSGSCTKTAFLQTVQVVRVSFYFSFFLLQWKLWTL